jgi:hypothetical protein
MQNCQTTTTDVSVPTDTSTSSSSSSAPPPVFDTMTPNCHQMTNGSCDSHRVGKSLADYERMFGTDKHTLTPERALWLDRWICDDTYSRKQFLKYVWKNNIFHPFLDARAADLKIHSANIFDSNFLIRLSSTVCGQITATYTRDGKIYHTRFIVTRSDDGRQFEIKNATGDTRFKSFQAFVEHLTFVAKRVPVLYL